MGELAGAAEETPLSKAQEILDLAFEEDDPERRADIARQALTVSPDCADAYILLAEHADSRKGALALYERVGFRREPSGLSVLARELDG